ncbi:ribosomal L15 [Viridothelium virens]|uniref:Ribosomal L15 n=1 Tax=Viridothelium virens TaxID=1048519 RepID=A0A6A6HGQ4_VIRVR|nr:ribosomal L15 [Viridothelium virens]
MEQKSHRFDVNILIRAKHLSYRRGKRTSNPGCSILKLEGVGDPSAARFYLGKRCAYVYRASKEVRGTKLRVIWGTITNVHGNSGAVRARFKHNLPARSFGASVRVMLYPSSI